MEKLILRGRGLLRRPLYPPCVSQRRLLSSGIVRLTTDASPLTTQALRDKTRLPDTPCRTRFAPSPTGYLHLGSLRTALFNYLLARATGGQFVLRLEDTDQSRLVRDAEARVYKDLKWAGLSWDEGPDKEGPYGPYRQSERLPLYQEHADKLVREGKAYRCFCSPEALEEHKKAAHESGQPTLYPGTCRNIPLEESDDRAHRGEQFAIRFKSGPEPFMIEDIIYNRFRKKDPEDDYIIIKRDGFPTYHFANVVDDRHMKITHVIRGAEWLVSTPKHVELYKAFDWEPPHFAHLGLLVDKNRQKLSKRDNSANLEFYQRGHILPSALLNFAVLLGWRAPPSTKEVLSLQDMVDNFSLKFTKGDIVVSLQKLPFLQEKHIERLAEKETRTPDEERLLHRHLFQPMLSAIDNINKAKTEGQLLAPPGNFMTAEIGDRLSVLSILDERYYPHLARMLRGTMRPIDKPSNRFATTVWKLRYLIWEVPEGLLEVSLQEGRLFPIVPADGAGKLVEAMAYLLKKFSAVDEASWGPETVKQALGELLVDGEYSKFFETDNPDTKDAQLNVWKPLRWALLGMDKGPPITDTMEVLGRSETLKRLEAGKVAAEKVAAKEPPPLEKELAVKGNEPLLPPGHVPSAAEGGRIQ